MNDPIQRFIDEYHYLQKVLNEQDEFSSVVNINEHYRKILLLSCASMYETEITDIIKNFVNTNSKDNRVFEFLNKKAINRQYHTYFDWKQTANINQFLSFFGEEFKIRISNEIKKDENLSKQISAFLIIGAERNKMVHGNFLEYKLEKTFDEIQNLHNSANGFIFYLRKIFSA